MWVTRQCRHHARLLRNLSHSLTHRVHRIAENKVRADHIEVIPLRRAPTDVSIGCR